MAVRAWRTRKWMLALAAAALVAAGAPGGRAAGQCLYTPTQIPEPACNETQTFNVVGHDINELGHVAGKGTCFIADQPFIWTGGPTITVLPMPPGAQSGAAAALNDSDVAVGNYFGADNRKHACKWVNGVRTDLPTMRRGNTNAAAAINSQGVIAGSWGNTITGPLHPCYWQDGQIVDLGSLITGSYGRATDLNDNMQIVGEMGTHPLFDEQAFIYSDGVMTGLGPIPGGLTSTAKAISENGTIAGYGWMEAPGSPDGYVERAFFWRDGVMTIIPPLPGYWYSNAVDVNDAGEVIGYCSVGMPGFSSPRAFYWKDGILSQPKYESGASLVEACGSLGGINNASQIIACDKVLSIQSAEADLTGDCVVNVGDLLTLILQWGPCTGGCSADFDEDGQVRVYDLLFLIMRWG